MDGDIIRTPVEFIQRHRRESVFFDSFRGNERIVDNHLHLEASGPVGDNGANFAEADDADDLVENFTPLELFLVPFAGLEGGGAPGNVPGKCQHHRDGVFGGGHDIACRCVHDDDAALGSRRNIDIVETDAGASDHLQPSGRFEQIFGHLCRAPDDQCIVIADNGFERRRCEAGFHVHVDARRLLEHLDPNFTKIVAYQNLHVFSPQTGHSRK